MASLNSTIAALLRRRAASGELKGIQHAVAQVGARAGGAPAMGRHTSSHGLATRAARPLGQQHAPTSMTAGVRALHTTPALLKKKNREPEEADDGGNGGGKRSKGGKRGETAPDDNGGKRGSSKGGKKGAAADEAADTGTPDAESSKYPSPSHEEPLDFSDVKARIEPLDERALGTLKAMRTTGRFNPDAVGAVRVAPDRKEPGQTFPLRELAQVAPKGGRSISVLVHDAEYIKPIMSAIQRDANFNQQPQRDPDNELELVLKMEMAPRDETVRRIKAVCREWRDKTKAQRQRREKLHVQWAKERRFVPDFKRRVDTELEKFIKGKMGEIDAAEKEALAAVEATK